ncbi:DUF6475 domain-containing protein [Campylobacter sp.]|uniref:DUF6475 domain-containing protein n=1 Tax=Campylobacter sp. TaxID=205 RepID=UPI002AA5E721|nr:DUF6475 domain-containing protein [Campylobacter sp.]MCI6661589.1 DUF6475 domain-containing protein [Campylobacter sp.]
MSEKEFLDGFNTLAIYFDFCADNPERLKANASIYYECLKHLGPDEWQMAVSAVLKERVYNSMPKIAELLNHIYGSPEERAVNAWTLVLDMMNKLGDYPSVRFDDDAIMHAIKALGGWVAVASIDVTSDSPMNTAKRKEFISAYLANRNKSFSEFYLRGRSEMQNGLGEFMSLAIISTEGKVVELRGHAAKKLIESKKSLAQLAFSDMIREVMGAKRIKAN